MVSTRQSSGHGEGASTSNWDSSGFRSSRHHQESTTESNQPQQKIFLLDLPQEIVEKILGYLKFKNISQLRTVSHLFDSICSNILNSSFHKLQNQMLTRFQSIKSRMPRRESARRNHPLACESDIVETLHMRLTLLHMTFGKHIERKHCCFFPGEILDEVHKILLYIASTPKLARPYKVTDELFDLSTMAMEYFKEKIEPTLPEISYFGTEFLEFTGNFPDMGVAGCTTKYVTMESPKREESPSHNQPSTPPASTPAQVASLNRTANVMRRRMTRMRVTMRRMNTQLNVTRRELKAVRGQNSEQRTQLAECKSRLDDCDKKNEEMTRKFGTLLQELNKCKTEFQYWRSKSPAIPLVCTSCGGIMQQPSSDELRGLLGADFVPIAGPSHEGNCQECKEPDGKAEITPKVEIKEEEEEEKVEAAAAVVVEPPRAKRKRDGGSRDSNESRSKSTRGNKGRKKVKL